MFYMGSGLTGAHPAPPRAPVFHDGSAAAIDRGCFTTIDRAMTETLPPEGRISELTPILAAT